MATKTKADPRFSAGAREERREVLAKVRREIRASGADAADGRCVGALKRMEAFLLGRQKRYSKRSGGL